MLCYAANYVQWMPFSTATSKPRYMGRQAFSIMGWVIEVKCIYRKMAESNQCIIPFPYKDSKILLIIIDKMFSR